MAQYKDGTYIVKDGIIYEVQIDIPRMMGAEVIHIALKDFKKHTNTDRIRSMTDEELADYLSGLVALDCYACPLKPCDYAKECEEVWLEWLKKEVKDG